MIETAHSLLIDAPISNVWSYVEDMRRWANFLPGCKECIVEDTANSRWILKVGTGGLVRTVNARVRIDKWDGPERVDFTYKLEGDPVAGSGSYIAARHGTSQTQVTLQVRVSGSGPLAPMWEALSKPLLPQLAKSFATQLKDAIEKSAPQAGSSASAGPGVKLRHLWSRRSEKKE